MCETSHFYPYHQSWNDNAVTIAVAFNWVCRIETNSQCRIVALTHCRIAACMVINSRLSHFWNWNDKSKENAEEKRQGWEDTGVIRIVLTFVLFAAFGCGGRGDRGAQCGKTLEWIIIKSLALAAHLRRLRQRSDRFYHPDINNSAPWIHSYMKSEDK